MSTQDDGREYDYDGADWWPSCFTYADEPTVEEIRREDVLP